MSAPRQIIGIHGLNNKPEPRVLADWWRRALGEGLAREGLITKLPPFKLAYWADFLHAAPVSPGDDPEPYLAAAGTGPLPPHSGSLKRKLAALGLEAFGKLAEGVAGLPGIERLVEHQLEHRVQDLYQYHADAGLRVKVQSRLIAALKPALGKGRPIMLIAHSMGSIIAYDVLLNNPSFRIAHFITVGSPLGLGEVKAHLATHAGPLRVPEGVARWSNFADQRDPIAALDMRLASDFAANEAGVAISDFKVFNTYVGPSGKANPHKIYGYLRTPEVARVVAEFSG
jgi:Lecithin:cholesterol acyltransferase